MGLSSDLVIACSKLLLNIIYKGYVINYGIIMGQYGLYYNGGWDFSERFILNSVYPFLVDYLVAILLFYSRFVWTVDRIGTKIAETVCIYYFTREIMEGFRSLLVYYSVWHRTIIHFYYFTIIKLCCLDCIMSRYLVL